MVNTPIQTMSSACQNNPKQKKRRVTMGWKPSVATCSAMITSHASPTVTCSPCVPTSAKKADRNALRDGPAPADTMAANSVTSIPRNIAPNTKVAAIDRYSATTFVRAIATAPKPQVTLEASRHSVSRKTCRLSNNSAPLGPPAVAPERTAYVANSTAKMMMSDSRKSQKPKPATTLVGAGPCCDRGMAEPALKD